MINSLVKATRESLVITEQLYLHEVEGISRDMTGRGRVGFLKPQDEGESYEEDRPDIQPLSQTSFVYDAHPGQALDAHRARLPVAKARDQLLYLLEMHQVPLFGKLPN